VNYHFIAIGGSVMHNLALALQAEGHRVSGSDDEIQDPSRSRLQAAGLLPSTLGWDPARVQTNLDAVIVGMHARADNPELLRAQELGLKIYSFPEFIYEHSKDKQRVVIAGSHGKTTITSMIMHVLKGLKKSFDYVVGAQLEGFERTVSLTKTAPIVVIEGDEYFTSPLDPQPKFLRYQPHILVLSGIAWDHVNVFPTEESYLDAFRKLLKTLPKAGMCIYNQEDLAVRELVRPHKEREELYFFPYETPSHRNKGGVTEVKIDGKTASLQIYGDHNLSNVAAAWECCKLFAVSATDFLQQLSTFKGAAMRLQKIYEDDRTVIIRDFAHSPSKVRATIKAVSEHYKNSNLIACLELHTFSSMNKDFIHQYRGVFKKVPHRIVFVNEETAQLKKMPLPSAAEISAAFQDPGIEYITQPQILADKIKARKKGSKDVILLMSSGNWGQLDLKALQ